MHKRVAWGALALLLSAGSAGANTPDQVCRSLMEARGFLVTMLEAPDDRGRDELKAMVHEASARVDQQLGGLADAARAAEFRKAWEAFKATRESEIIPAVYAGRTSEAKAIATGVQAERMKAMKAAMGCN